MTKQEHIELTKALANQYAKDLRRYEKMAKAYANKAVHMKQRVEEYRLRAGQLEKELKSEPV